MGSKIEYLCDKCGRISTARFANYSICKESDAIYLRSTITNHMELCDDCFRIFVGVLIDFGFNVHGWKKRGSTPPPKLELVDPEKGE